MVCGQPQSSCARYWIRPCLQPRHLSQTSNHSATRRNDSRVVTQLGSQSIGLHNARIRPCSTLLAYKDARSISLLEQDNNPSWLVNKYLDSVVDQKIRQCQTSKLPFLPVVLSYSGMMIGIRTKVFAS